MASRPPVSGPKRVAYLVRVIAFCGLISLHLVVILYWVATGSRPSVRVEPKGYNNVLGDMEPRLHMMDREIPGLPYAVTTNAEGLRGTEPVGLAREPHSLRVLCLGDSYTYGVGVADPFTYPAQLQLLLKKRLPGRPVQVINAGVPFYDIFDELAYFREKGVRLAPDVVVLQFYGDDLEAMAGSFFRQDLLVRQGGAYNVLDQLSGREAVERWINAWLEARLPRLLAACRAGDIPGGPSPGQTGPFRSYHLQPTDRERELLTNHTALLQAGNIPDASRLWDNYRRALLVFREAVVASGAAFLFVIAPDVRQVREDLNAPAAALVPFCREHGIPVIDMNRVLRSMSGENPGRYFFVPLNAHPNVDGNTIVATTVADALHVAPEPGRPEVAVAPLVRSFGYVGPLTLDLRFDGDAVAPARKGPVSITTIRSHNLVPWAIDMGGGNRISGLKADLARDPVGELVLRLDSQVPLDQVSVTFFRRLFPPVNGFVQLAWSRDDKDYRTMLFASDKDVAAPEDFEVNRLVEVDLRDQPARQLYLRLVLRNEAQIFGESKYPPWRRFEVVCYPSPGTPP
mgnify:CR=1 FL=1